MKKLGTLLQAIEYAGTPDLQQDIDIVVMDSRKVREGALFVCVKGRTFDGHDVAAQMLQQGARAVVAQRPLGLPNEIVVKDSRAVFAKLCHNYFDNPQDKLSMVAVTGTNGKTTVSSVIKQSLEILGHKAGLIGTIRSEIGEIHVPAKFTTPEAWDLSALLYRMVSAGCSHVVMEASSQALAQGRLADMVFDCAVFTNLTRDHLDYHETMEAYYAAKKSLFDQSKCGVINLDDEAGRQMAEEVSIPTLTVSAGGQTADYVARGIHYAISGVTFEAVRQEDRLPISFPMPGAYSVNNALCALAALVSLGIDGEKAARAVSAVPGVRGRCEVLYHGDYTIIGDFAHTADALEQLLSTMRPFVTEGRMIVLSGCAGDRDPIKRPDMAAALCRYADFIVLSADNPRTEDPLNTFADFEPTILKSGKPFKAIADRYVAIEWAIEQLQPGDVLLLCGKGHEDYQVLDGYSTYLDEREMVRERTQQMN